MIHFIGIGAQKSGTSWAYTNLYEHPQVCAPIKEIHFFSRPRYENGIEWYESHFAKCAPQKIRGEFSTSYLYSPEAPERIHAHYPSVKLIAILRNPIDRAFSQYRNAIKAGEIPESEPFEVFAGREESVIAQGRYAEQIARYDTLFSKDQLLILIYEDIKKDPIGVMRQIYSFLNIDPSFVSSMVHTEINIARTPKYVGIDRSIHYIAEFLRRTGFDRIVHAVKKSGITDAIRSINTKSQDRSTQTQSIDRGKLGAYFIDDVRKLSERTGRDLITEWNVCEYDT